MNLDVDFVIVRGMTNIKSDFAGFKANAIRGGLDLAVAKLLNKECESCSYLFLEPKFEALLEKTVRDFHGCQ